MSEAPPARAELARRCLALLQGARWGALATLGEEGPLASMVAYRVAPALDAVYLHLSTLAPHTGNLLARGAASLVVSEPDPGSGDPQTLARASVGGAVTEIPRDDPEYLEARARYLERLPDAEPLFGFGDFRLFRLAIERVHYVGGFARAARWEGPELARLAAG